MLFIDDVFTINLIGIDIELGVFHYCVCIYVFPVIVSSVPGQEFVMFCFSARNELDTHIVVARWSATACLHAVL